MEKTTKRAAKNSATGKPSVDIYRRIVESEEKEAKSRDSKIDAKIYIDTCDEIRKIMAAILKLKRTPNENKEVINKQRIQACILISVLKKLNRLEKVRLSTSRDAINAQKQKVESKYMQYQNLLYEVDHYHSEFRKCMQYKSRDEEIDLISTAAFFQNASEDITIKFLGEEENKHELYLARLDYELNQRINLATLLEQLKVEKKKIKEEIDKVRMKLNGLEPKLADVVSVIKPFQEHLGLSTKEIHVEHQLAKHLPDPLYLMYCNTDAFRQFISNNCITMDVKGDLEEVLQFIEKGNITMKFEETDAEHDNQEEPSESKKHRRRRITEGDREVARKKLVTEKFPLIVEVTIKTEHAILKIQFNYLPVLRIATISSNTEILNEELQNSACALNVLTGESILNELYPKDTGTKSPNLVNNYQLKQIGIEHYQTLIPQIGYAYEWAQKICGLEFLNLQNFANRLKNKDKVYLHLVEDIFTIIKRRLNYRAGLAMQLRYLEQNIIPAIPDNVVHPKNTTTTLMSFASVTFQRFCLEAKNTRELLEQELVSENDMFYLAELGRPKVTLHVWINVKNDYPTSPPRFFVHVNNGKALHHANSDEIRELEKNLNATCDWTKNKDGRAEWLLASQFKYLCSLLDVYLETQPHSPYQSTTVFFQRVSGRARRRPFKFHKSGNGIFAQY